MGLTFDRHSKAVLRTKRWQALRWEILERDGFACVRCGARGRLEVDHIHPVRTHPELSFDRANLQSLCTPCHTFKTNTEVRGTAPDPERAAWRKAVAQIAAQPIEHERN